MSTRNNERGVESLWVQTCKVQKSADWPRQYQIRQCCLGRVCTHHAADRVVVVNIAHRTFHTKSAIAHIQARHEERLYYSCTCLWIGLGCCGPVSKRCESPVEMISVDIHIFIEVATRLIQKFAEPPNCRVAACRQLVSNTAQGNQSRAEGYTALDVAC